MTTDEPSAALRVLSLDGRGGARTLDPGDITHWTPSAGVLWVHVDIGHEGARELLREVPGLDARQAALLAGEGTRPHADIAGESVRLVLRGVNLHPDADPEDLVSLRLWAAAGRVASGHRHHLLSVDDVLDALADGRGPRSAGELLAALAGRLVARLDGVVDALDERVLAIEEAVAREPPVTGLRRDIADARRTLIMLHRYLAPQRDALGQLGGARLPWLGAEERLELRDALDVTMRHVENLDSLRERAGVAREELAGQQAALTNRRMFLLSLLSAVFLPLSFVTGLFGMNVGGVPLSATPLGFALVGVVLAAIGVGIVLAFRFGRWL